MKRYFSFRLVAACVAAGVSFAGAAMAQTAQETAYFNLYSCSDSTHSASGTYWQSGGGGEGYDRSTYNSNCASGHTSNTPGSVITAVTTLRAASSQTVGLISDRIAAVRTASVGTSPLSASLDENGSSGEFGLSGGDKKRGIGVWVQGTFASVNNDATATKFDGKVFTGLLGVDKQLGEKAILGLAAGYERSNLDTDYNLGEIDGSGYLVSPYASFSINNNFSVNVSGGYAWLDYDMNRRESTPVDETFTGKTDATRYWGAISAVGEWQRDKLTYGANVGVMYSKENRDAFSETGSGATGTVLQGKVSSQLGQARLGGEVAYDLGKVQPFLNARAEYDFTKSNTVVASNQTKPSDDDFGAVVGGGLNLNFSPSVSGQISGEYGGLFRDDYSDYSATARLRVEF